MTNTTRCAAGELLVGWLDTAGHSQTWLAQELGTNRVTLWRYISGERSMPGELGMRIERLTHGAVPIAAWYLTRKAA